MFPASREYVSLSCHRTSWSLEGGYLADEGGIELHFSIELEVGSHFLGDAGSFDDLVDSFVVSTPLSGEAEHGDAWLNASDSSCRLSRGDRDLGKLFGCRGRHDCAVSEEE